MLLGMLHVSLIGHVAGGNGPFEIMRVGAVLACRLAACVVFCQKVGAL
jgi:hypothetical protein